ncbi:MAG: hypothetical protein ACFFGZ_02835 [Candidatus Thorarchaeota archaeon]
MTIVSDATQEMITEVYLTTDLLHCPEDSIRIFALDAHTIGLSNNPPKLWEEQCLWEKEAIVTKDEDELTIILPREVVRFYRPKKIEIAGSMDKENVILVIGQ